MDRGHSRLYPFDPDSGCLPEIAAPGALLSGAGGGVVTLIVAPGVTRSSWSPAAAIAIARAWSDQGHRVVLFDVSLTAPVLHATLGLPNAVGIVDLVLREASLPAVTQRTGTPGFQFVSVGAPVDDPTEVTLSDEWATFVAEVGHADATVLFYVPADLPGVDAMVARSVARLLLAGDPTEAEWVAESFALDHVVGLVEDRGKEVAHTDEVFEVPPPPASSSPPGDECGLLSTASSVASGQEENEITPEQLEPGPQRIPWRAALAGTLVGLGALAAWQLAYTSSAPVAQIGPVAMPETTVAPKQARSPAGPPQGHSLALAAYEIEGAASQQVQRMAQRRPDLLFLVAPVRVGGRVYHRVLAGPAEDSAGAERLRASLAETLGENGSRWIVRETPLAFYFGEFESLDAAQGRAVEVRDGGLGAYVLEVPGSPAHFFRVYAGAYQSPAEAVVMWEVVNAAFGGAPALEPRMGRFVR